MNVHVTKLFRFALLASLLVTPVIAQEDAAEDEEVEFKPRTTKASGQRIGGASRGTDGDTIKPPSVSVLAPAVGAGLTTREQPVIHWYLSADTDKRIDITLNAAQKTLLDVHRDGPTKAGLQKLDLAEVKQDGKPVKLDPDVKYELVITVVVNEKSGSVNPTAICPIMRIDAKQLSAPAPGGDDKAKLASFYAKEGVWFDYIDALNAAIEAKPKDEALRQRRAKSLQRENLMMQPDGSIKEQPNAGAAER